MFSREELRGIPRPGNDVDWTQEVPTISLSATTLPPPIQISLADILNKVSTKKPQLLLPSSNNAAPVNGMTKIALNCCCARSKFSLSSNLLGDR